MTLISFISYPNQSLSKWGVGFPFKTLETQFPYGSFLLNLVYICNFWYNYIIIYISKQSSKDSLKIESSIEKSMDLWDQQIMFIRFYFVYQYHL